MDRKLKGSFYTPKVIADFLVTRIAQKKANASDLKILEPSCGDGIFIHSIFTHDILHSVSKVTAVEKERKEINKIKIKGKKLEKKSRDFLNFQEKNESKYSIILGNPPYIKKNYLTEAQLDKCRRIHQLALLAKHEPKNIWTAFLVRCIEMLTDDGILALVLPSELLQVKFAAELRTFILKNFERVEIFTFNELIFKDCKGQDTLLLIGEKSSTAPGVFYSNVDKVADLGTGTFTLAQNANIRESKWTHNHILPDEYELLDRIKSQLQNIDTYCSSKAGIVTAANNFFIVNQDKVEEYSMERYVRPIIQRGMYVNGSVVFTEAELTNLVINRKPTFLLALDNHSVIRRNQRINKYLQEGKKQKLHKRYKMTKREKWYQVPNIGQPPEGFFFKRCDEYPKLLRNDAMALSTDSAYTITMRKNFVIENLIFSFYNSLTLSLAELSGRYYGGGVLELTPNEFKSLPVPYVPVTAHQFNEFVTAFESKDSIKDVCERNDALILRSVLPNLTQDELTKLAAIREKLFLRRIKTN